MGDDKEEKGSIKQTEIPDMRIKQVRERQHVIFPHSKEDAGYQVVLLQSAVFPTSRDAFPFSSLFSLLTLLSLTQK